MAEPNTPQDKVYHDTEEWHFPRGLKLHGVVDFDDDSIHSLYARTFIKSPTTYTLSAGGSPKYTIAQDSIIGSIDEHGCFRLGKNLLDDSHSGSNHGSLPDFLWNARDMRLFVRAISVGEMNDPCDINLRRFGPDNGYPYAKGPLLDGTPADMTGLDTNVVVGQLRATASRVPYQGTPTTPGGRAVNPGATLNFITAEMPRQTTADDSQAVGTIFRITLAPVGDYIEQYRFSVMPSGSILMGRQAIESGDTLNALAQIRTEVGTNAKMSVTTTGLPTGGTFSINHYPTIPVNGYPVPEVSGGVQWNSSAAALQGILEAMPSIGVGQVVCTGGPLPTAIVCELTGTLAGKNFTKWTMGTNSLTGGTSPRAVITRSVVGIQHEKTKKLLHMRHCAGATADYFVIDDDAGVNALRLDNAKNLYAEGFISSKEIADPGAAPADRGRIYFRDNGAGKTQLCVVFNTGAVQVLATQP